MKNNQDILELIIKARENYREEVHNISRIIQGRLSINNKSEIELGEIIKFKNGKKYYISGVSKDSILIFPYDFNPDTGFGVDRTWHSLDKFEIE